MANTLRSRFRNALGAPTLSVPEDNENNPLDQKAVILDFMRSRKPGSILSCNVNRMDILAPIEMLRMWPHCLHPSPDETLTYLVETAQSDWACSKVGPGDAALDVGAAFGLITIALSLAVGEQGQVHAFEPARGTRKSLGQFMALNNLENVTVAETAVSDKAGVAEFIEFTPDNDLIWASDTSTLAAGVTPTQDKYDRYDVEVTTIDDYVKATNIRPKVMKIDIEGVELYALHGAKATLEEWSPALCIDIHQDVRTGESAKTGVESFLSGLGYESYMDGHAMYAERK